LTRKKGMAKNNESSTSWEQKRGIRGPKKIEVTAGGEIHLTPNSIE